MRAIVFYLVVLLFISGVTLAEIVQNDGPEAQAAVNDTTATTEKTETEDEPPKEVHFKRGELASDDPANITANITLPPILDGLFISRKELETEANQLYNMYLQLNSKLVDYKGLLDSELLIDKAQNELNANVASALKRLESQLLLLQHCQDLKPKDESVCSQQLEVCSTNYRQLEKRLALAFEEARQMTDDAKNSSLYKLQMVCMIRCSREAEMDLRQWLVMNDVPYSTTVSRLKARWLDHIDCINRCNQ